MSDTFAVKEQVLTTLQTQQHWVNSLGVPELLGLALGYLLLSVFVAFIFWQLMPTHYRKESLWGFILLLSFNVFYPVFGMIGSGLFTIYLHRLVRHEKPDPMVTVTHMSFQTKFHSSIHHSYGEGGARAKLYAENVSNSGRVAALLALTAVKGPGTNTLLHETLTEDVDELRLLAFGLIDDQEKQIYESIRRMQNILKTMDLSKDIQASVKKDLASFHWELCYLELVHGDMLEEMLDKSKAYAEEALETMTNDSRLWVVLARNYMRRGNYDKALNAFKNAIERDAATSKVLPYLADLYYRSRDFDNLRNVLSQCKNLKDIPALGPVIKFWSLA